MLKLDFMELILRAIPEAFIMVYGIHILSKQKLNICKYITASSFIALLIYSVRFLPIYFGVHMIINILIDISILAVIGIPLIKAIYSTLLIFFILSLSEFLNICILDLFNIYMFEAIGSFQKILYGMPSLFIMIIFILIIEYMIKKKEGKENVNN